MAEPTLHPAEFLSFLGSCPVAASPSAVSTPGRRLDVPLDQFLRDSQLFWGNQDLYLKGRFHAREIDYPGWFGDVSLEEGATISLFGMSRYGAFAIHDDVVMKGVEAFLGLDIIGMSQKKRGLANFLAGRIGETNRVRYLMPDLFGYGIPVGNPGKKLRESPVGRTLLEPVPGADLFKPSGHEPTPMTIGLQEALDRLEIVTLYRPPPNHEVQGRADLFVDKQRWDANVREGRFLAFDFDFLLPGSHATYRALPLTLIRSFLPEELKNLEGTTDLEARYDAKEKVLYVTLSNLAGRVVIGNEGEGMTTVTLNGGLEATLRYPGKVEIRPYQLRYRIEVVHPEAGVFSNEANIEGVVVVDLFKEKRKISGTKLSLEGEANWSREATRVTLRPFSIHGIFPAEGPDLTTDLRARVVDLPISEGSADLHLKSEFLLGQCEVRSTFDARFGPLPLGGGYRLAGTRVAGRLSLSDLRNIRTRFEMASSLRGPYSGPLHLAYDGAIRIDNGLRLLPREKESRLELGPIRGESAQFFLTSHLRGPLVLPWDLKDGTYRGTPAGGGLTGGQLHLTAAGEPPCLAGDRLELLLVGPVRRTRPGLVDGRGLRLRGHFNPHLLSILFSEKVGTIQSPVWAELEAAPAFLPLNLEELARMIRRGGRR